MVLMWTGQLLGETTAKFQFCLLRCSDENSTKFVQSTTALSFLTSTLTKVWFVDGKEGVGYLSLVTQVHVTTFVQTLYWLFYLCCWA